MWRVCVKGVCGGCVWRRVCGGGCVEEGVLRRVC